MTLKENFENILHNWIDEDYDRKNIAKELEIDVDEFAIEFSEWLLSDCYLTPNLEWDWFGENYTTKELLEIYKKEKGL